tara:strand:- start:640 stop:921 length:282 start_codon:yes stop_codon:yes gene_type:complete
MWEIIERMATDRLWIYTALAGSIFGALFVAWATDTRIALWAYGKWAALLNFFVNRWGWTWFKQDPNAWKKLNPQLSKKIEELETRIKELESKK